MREEKPSLMWREERTEIWGKLEHLFLVSLTTDLVTCLAQEEKYEFCVTWAARMFANGKLLR